jgi:hypothetical protein
MGKEHFEKEQEIAARRLNVCSKNHAARSRTHIKDFPHYFLFHV